MSSIIQQGCKGGKLRVENRIKLVRNEAWDRQYSNNKRLKKGGGQTLPDAYSEGGTATKLIG